ncbi:unnamed protein product [Schistosoma curassoni]|uniref:DUF4408 domain-containing protein n=1 Tax=Schistosoma curassoni TaxID=6186 RepID=A0A183KXH8_9TREM|nr:unnamed protein product [Schistosoma curassoni]
MVEPAGTYVPANITRLGHHDRQARPPRQGSSFDRAAFECMYSSDLMMQYSVRNLVILVLILNGVVFAHWKVMVDLSETVL